MAIYTRVPTPLVQRVTEVSSPTRNGTSTVAPNIAKRCWSDSGTDWSSGSRSVMPTVRVRMAGLGPGGRRTGAPCAGPPRLTAGGSVDRPLHHDLRSGDHLVGVRDRVLVGMQVPLAPEQQRSGLAAG